MKLLFIIAYSINSEFSGFQLGSSFFQFQFLTFKYMSLLGSSVEEATFSWLSSLVCSQSLGKFSIGYLSRQSFDVLN